MGIELAMLLGSLISAGAGVGGSILNSSAQRKANDAQNKTNRFQSNLDFINNQQSLLNNTQINDIMGERINQFRCGGSKKRKHITGGPDEIPYAVRDNTRVGYVPTGMRTRNVVRKEQPRLDDGVQGMIPVVGDALSIAQAVDDVKNKDYMSAAMLPITMLLGAGAGKAAKGIGRKVLQKGRIPINKAISNERRLVDNTFGNGAYKEGLRSKDVEKELTSPWAVNEVGWDMERENAAKRLGINWEPSRYKGNDINYRNLIDAEIDDYNYVDLSGHYSRRRGGYEESSYVGPRFIKTKNGRVKFEYQPPKYPIIIDEELPFRCGGKTKLKHRVNGGEVRQVKSDFMDRISFYKMNR